MNSSGDFTIYSSYPNDKEAIDYLEKLGVATLGPNCVLKMENCTFINKIDAYMYCVTTQRNDLYWMVYTRKSRWALRCLY